jgi:hypothetical protein
MSQLLSTLQALEVELHHPGVRSSRDRLEFLLHPDFHEVGRSGRTYSRDTVIQFLVSQEQHAKVLSDRFLVAEPGSEIALLTYRSAQLRQDGGLSDHTLRSSLWSRSRVGWQLRFHQGTPAAEPW